MLNIYIYSFRETEEQVRILKQFILEHGGGGFG